MAYCPRSSLPAKVLAWLAARLAHLALSRPPGRAAPRRCRWRCAWTRSGRSSWTGCRTGARAGRSGSPRPRSATAWTCCSARWPAWGSASPTARLSPPSKTCARCLRRWPKPARRCGWTGWASGCSGPPGGPTRRSCMTPSGTPTPRRVWPCRPSTVTCCGWMGLAGQLPRAGAAGAVGAWWGAGRRRGRRPGGPGFRGMAKGREHWHAPVGDRRTKDRLSDAQRAFNRCQAGLRALVEQAIGHLANAWGCAAGAGCCTASATCTGPPARWSAWADGCIGSRCEAASRTPSMSRRRAITSYLPTLDHPRDPQQAVSHWRAEDRFPRQRGGVR